MFSPIRPIPETVLEAQPDKAGPYSLRLYARESTSLCLPAGHELYCLEGQAWLEAGPLLYGQVLGQSRLRLEAGQCLQLRQTLWLRISAGTDVHLALHESRPQPLLAPWLKAWAKAMCKRLGARRGPRAA